MTPDQDQLAVDTIRGLSMDAVQKANSGHPGTPMALAALGHVVFSRLRRHDPQHPEWADRDRFVLSCGHASMLQYSLLHLFGYEVSLQDIKDFRQWGSRTPGHPEWGHTAGVETTTGPLGQGVGNGVGMAMAEHWMARRYNRPGHDLFDHNTFVIASDGDLMEGVSAEASSLAGHLGLGKLIVFWDDNSITIDGRTDITFTEDVLARYRSYGWHTESVDDGENLDTLEAAGRAAMAETTKPSLIRVRTIIGNPAPHKKDTSGAHGAPLGVDEIAATKRIMKWPSEPFHVPPELSALSAVTQDRGSTHWAEWEDKLKLYKVDHPKLALELDSALKGELPLGWDSALTEFPADAKGVASRKASGQILNDLAKHVENLVGGSADLAGSNNSWQKGRATFGDAEGQDTAGNAPANVHFGVREHGMGSIMNGMALHGGVIPYGATFLVFSDYMRPSIRLAALMNLPTRYIFTHDSIGLGEDGPTHQPVEHVAALRAIPNLKVFRPGDANETRECWKAAMNSKGPAALVLTRQNLPTLDRSTFASADGVKRGAYVLSDPKDAAAQVVIMASGSEVGTALGAAELLAKDGIHTRVVSAPCLELFAEQDESYQQQVLPRSMDVRVVVEAGIRQGWDRYAGFDGIYITMESFGASAPAETLFEKFGFSAENVAAQVKARLSK